MAIKDFTVRSNVGIGTATVIAGQALAVYTGNIQIGTTGNGLRFPDGSFQTTASSSTPGGSTGAVQYRTAGGAFGGDSTKFYYDSTNYRLSIGASENSTATLNVAGSVPSLFNTLNGGDPQIIVGTSTTVGAALGYNTASAYGYLKASPSGTSMITWKSTGVGINTPTPLNTLDINGKAVIGVNYAGAVTAPTSGLLVEGAVGIGTSTINSGNALAVFGGNIQIGTAGSSLRFPDGTMQTTAAAGTSITITNDTSTNANTYYPSLTNNVTSGTLSALTTSSTKLFYNPSTGALNSSVFIPSGSTAPTNGMYLPAANTVGFATNSSEKMRIDANGNVGIGTSTPAARLHVPSNVITGYLQHSPVILSKLLSAFDAGDQDRHCIVSLSSDASVLAVGAYQWEGATGTNRGGVYIYDWSGSAWVQRGSMLEAADATDGDQFGVSVSLSSDGSVLAVGAYQWEGATGTDRGGVYIYDWSGSAWVQRGSVLEAADAADNDRFGVSVSLSSDASILAVGAYRWEGATGTDRGGVYIYDWSGSAWVQRGSVLEAADAADSDEFGVGVSLSSNGSILAVGSDFWEGATGTNRGGVYIYDWSGSAWVQRGPVLEAADAADDDVFGYWSSVSLNSTGTILAVGAFGWEGATGTDRGGVYIYDWNGSSWVQRGSVLEAADAADDDRYCSVSLSSDGSVLVAGAFRWEGATGTNTGAVYTYTLTGAMPGGKGVATGSGWLETANSKLVARTSGLDRITTDANGNVGIGNTAPDSKLVVQDTLTGNGSTVQINPTWNVGSNTVTALKMNVTDTASGSSSLLMDLKVGGTSQFTVKKNGSVSMGARLDAGIGELTVEANRVAARYGDFDINGSGTGVDSAGVFYFSNTASNATFVFADTFLSRKAAANLRFGAADAATPVAQTLSVQSVVAGTTDGAGQPFTFTGSQSTGTGVPGNILIQTASSAATTGSAQNALATVATFGPSTLRLAQTTPALDLAQTWNTSGTVTGLKLNVTDTASNGASLLMDLKVGGTSQFSVGKAGNATATNGSAATPSYAMGTTGLYTRVASLRLNFAIAGADSGVEIGPTVLALQNNASLSWASGLLSNSNLDLILSRKAAANFQLGAADAAAPVAQTLSVQSVVAGTANTAGANLTIQGSQSTGNGAGGSIIFQVAPAGTGANTSQNALATALTIASDKSATFSGTVKTNTITSNGDFYLQMQNGAGIQHAGFWASGTAGALGGVNGAGFALGANYEFGWSGTNYDPVNAVDLKLARDAANILAQRRGTSNQTSRIYGTYTDASNYERISISANSTAAYVQTESAGTGSARPLVLGTGSLERMRIDANGYVGIGTSTPTSTLHVIGNANIYSTTASTSTTTGAIITAGGVGIAGAVNAGGQIYTASTLNAGGTATVNSLVSNGAISGTTITASTGLTVSSGGASITGASTITGNLTVTGNLFVTGNVNTVNSNVLVVEDPLIYVGKDNPSNNWDLGLVGSYNSGTYYHTGIARNKSDGIWSIFDTLVTEPVAATGTIDWANASYGSFRAGNINVSSTTASVSSTTGALKVAGGAGIAGNLNVGGTTSSFAGNVGIGTTAPTSPLHVGLASSVSNQVAAKIAIGSNALITLGERANTNYGGLIKLHDGLGGSGNFVMEYNGGYPQFTTTQGGHSFSFTGSGGGGLRVNNAYMDYITGGVTRFVVSGGSVGIGTGSPAKKLDLYNSGTTTTDFVIRNGTVSLLSFVDSIAGYTGTSTNHPLLFTSNNLERMRIDANGNVGIGTSTINTGNALAVFGGNIYIGSTGSSLRFSDGTMQTTAFNSTSAVTSFSAGTTGLTPSTATTGAITLAGTLAVGNGGSGTTTFTANGVLYGNSTSAIQVTAQGAANSILVANAGAPSFSAAPTIGTSVTSPLHIGGTAASSSLTLQSTSGAGTSDSILFKVGNNGATTAMTINTSGNVGIGTSTINTGNALAVYGGNVFINGSVTGTTIIPTGSSAPTNGMYLPAANSVGWSTNSSEKMRVDSSGNVGIGTTSTVYKLEVNGSFAATTKSFVISHPTKRGMKLRYGSLEGPENGVYIRGRLTGSNTIELPDYWTKLVDKDSITVNLTPIGKTTMPSVGKITSKKITILGDPIDCFFMVLAERKDVDKLQVEI